MFDFQKSFKYFAAGYGILIIAGLIVFMCFGVKLNIDFSGGSRFTFTYEDKIDVSEAQSVIEDTIGKKVDVSESKSFKGDTNKLIVSLQSKVALSSDTQSALLKALQDKFTDNNVKLGDSNTVNPTVAGSFFAKAIVAVIIAAVLVVLYVGVRFRKIGGITAAISALAALVLDIAVAFITCIFFRLQIDANFIAVVLTILGYSLNDTVVIYDRVRENKRNIADIEVRELVNSSINQVMARSITTNVATLLSIVTILVVSELYGLTTLRTFAIPMVFGLFSGCLSTLTISGPLWVIWKERSQKKAALKKS